MARTGVVTLKGTKIGRETVALVGYDEQARYSTNAVAHVRAQQHPFRAITQRGSQFGQAGRVWLSAASLSRILKDGGSVVGVKL